MLDIDLSKFGPPSAHGCGICEHGLLNPPPVRAYIGLYIIRAIQMDKGYLQFCFCEAGERYEAYLRRKLVDIQGGREYVHGNYWKMVILDAEEDGAGLPTMHLEPSTAVFT